MEQWCEKAWTNNDFLAKISVSRYGYMLKKHCKYNVFVDIQRFVNYSNNDANMTLTSTIF